MKWKTVSFEDGVNSRGSGASGLAQSQWEEGGQYPVIGQGAEFIEGWSNRADLLLLPNLIFLKCGLLIITLKA